MRSLLIGALLALGLTLSPQCLALAQGLPDRPLALDDCISLARQYNPSLFIARQEVIAGDARLRRSLSSYYPAATLTATRGRTGGSSFLETPAGTVTLTTAASRRDSQIGLGHVIWETGRKETVRRARRALGAAHAGERTALQELILSVSESYYAALAAERLVDVAEATLTSARDHEKLVKAGVEVGETPPVDAVPAEADVADAEFALLQAQNNAGLAKARLKSEVGLPPTYRLRLERPMPSQDEEPLPSLEDALRLSLEKRPEATALRESVAASRHSLRLAKAVRHATITVSAQYERDLTGPRQGGESWAAIVSATAFLFDGGAREADVEAARANVGSQQGQEQQLINAIGLDVESVLLDVETARKSVDAAEKAVAGAEAQLAAAEAKYRQGVGIFVEILDAQRAVTRARTNQAEALYDYETARVALRRAMGLLAPPPARDAGP
jgi:outer membrane protein